ncbi:uncharacterized protein N7483_005997 [Penicillium malachiteum]|uniref:uncharacterized protein n=1 Tax=Penicillium malachiteum TaxID=1324776 RepID=UPI002547E59B|nr:uncharacterized protein N7483_005997 [Penicillium malachiteum]KAJ5731489.1 hypothetical protein N7483_005997 [Penicillium malachiteum]
MAKKIRALLEKEPGTPLNEASMNEESHHEGIVHLKSRSLSRFDSLESVEIGSQDISMTAFSGEGFTQHIQSTVSLDSRSVQESRMVQQDTSTSDYQFSELPKRPVSR